MLEDLTKPNASDRSFFSDWGDPREYSLSDHGVGECAGEVVSPVDFELTAAEREVFEAQIAFENGGQVKKARETAYRAMVHAAKALVKLADPGISDDADKIVSEFRTLYLRYAKILGPVRGRKIRELPLRCA
jgi:sulfite reductase (ferredoxin)